MRFVVPLPFAKTEAHGNDFVLVSEQGVIGEPSLLARAICDRRVGVGADGLILYGVDGKHFRMTLFNSDGSPAEISGNGLRCLAAYLDFAGLSARPDVEVATGAGLLSLSALGREGSTFRFRADMGPPRNVQRGVTLEVEGRSVEVTTLSMGNPHCVVFADRSELLDVGPRLERHPHFPEKTNVEIVELVDRHAVRMAIWERGAGETASSGTGSAASAVAAIVNRHADSPVRVHCRGGTLEVAWTKGGGVFVTGESTVVAEGNFLIDWSRT